MSANFLSPITKAAKVAVLGLGLATGSAQAQGYYEPVDPIAPTGKLRGQGIDLNHTFAFTPGNEDDTLRFFKSKNRSSIGTSTTLRDAVGASFNLDVNIFREDQPWQAGISIGAGLEKIVGGSGGVVLDVPRIKAKAGYKPVKNLLLGGDFGIGMLQNNKKDIAGGQYYQGRLYAEYQRNNFSITAGMRKLWQNEYGVAMPHTDDTYRMYPAQSFNRFFIGLGYNF